MDSIAASVAPAVIESGKAAPNQQLLAMVQKAFADYDEAVGCLRADGRMTAPERKP